MIYRLSCNPSKHRLIEGFASGEHGIRRLVVERWAKLFLKHESQFDIRIDMERGLVEVRPYNQPIVEKYPYIYYIHEYTDDPIHRPIRSLLD